MLININGFLRSTVLLSALNLLASPVAGQANRPPGVPPAPERLVAEATIRYHVNNADVVLPVTLHGHTVTMLLGFGIDADVELAPTMLAQLNIPLSDTTQLDSLTLGTTVEHHLAMQTLPQVPGAASPNLPPLVGLLGNVFLARYDIVYDGPARRVRLYARPRQTTAASAPSAWLPPEMASVSCTPITPLPEHNAGFAIQANGHPIHAILETVASYTKMNMVAARTIGLTQHSPNVHPLPADIWEKQDAFGHPVKYQATDIRLTLGTQSFTEVPMLLFPSLDLDQYTTPVPPTLLLNPDDLQHQILLFSESSGRVCLSVPRQKT
jgi:hypothetical protein